MQKKPRKQSNSPHPLHEGVIIACDAAQEWLLSWWWQHYSTYNHIPVAIFDFGLSPKGIEWAKEKGIYLQLQGPFHPFLPDEAISEETKQNWFLEYDHSCLKSRQAWQKKPYALLETPFTYSLWIDLDCQVQKDLSPLFTLLKLGIDIAIAKDIFVKKRPWLGQQIPLYNSGVIAFKQHAPILRLWADTAAEWADRLAGDQESLSLAFQRSENQPFILPEIYNYFHQLPEGESAAIRHFSGFYGKLQILQSLHEPIRNV